MIKLECQPTLCFLYSPVDSEIIHVNNDSCRSPSFPSACLAFSLFLSIPPSLPPRLSPSHSLSSPALYHSVPVTVTVRAFGAPRRHSHVAAADMRMWPWLAAPWRATREHLKGCLTAGWEILGSPRGPRTSGFRRKLYVQTQNARAPEQGARNLVQCRTTSAWGRTCALMTRDNTEPFDHDHMWKKLCQI